MLGRTQQLREELGSHLGPLLAGATASNTTARNRLLEAVRPMAIDLGRRAYRMTWEDSEDLAQEVLLRVSERLPQLRHAQTFPLWVRRIIHHAALDALRRRRELLSQDTVTEEDDLIPVAPAADPRQADAFTQVLMHLDLDRALAQLPLPYREPLRLHLFQGLSQAEIAEVLGRPPGTVASQIERGLKRMRRSAPPLFS